MSRFVSFLACLTLAATAATSSSAWALSTPEPIWEGTAFVTAVTAACNLNGHSLAVGDSYVTTYRQLVQTAGNGYKFGGGIAFNSERSSMVYEMPEGVQLNGGVTNASTPTLSGVSSLAYQWTYGTAPFAVTIAPPTLSASVNSVTINGTFQNFWGWAGCTATIRSSLALRP